jgi:hypothetical protein
MFNLHDYDDAVNANTENADQDAGAERDAAVRVSKRWGLARDPIVAGELVYGVRAKLTLESGRRITIEDVGDLFDAGKHTRVVSLQTRTRFPRLSPAEAAATAQDVLAICGGEVPDPLELTRSLVGDFAASAGATVNSFDAETYAAEAARMPKSGDPASRAVVVINDEEWWLPAGLLHQHVAARLAWRVFTATMAELGFERREIDARPGTRAERAAGDAARVCRVFYIAPVSGVSGTYARDRRQEEPSRARARLPDTPDTSVTSKDRWWVS